MSQKPKNTPGRTVKEDFRKECHAEEGRLTAELNALDTEYQVTLNELPIIRKEWREIQDSNAKTIDEKKLIHERLFLVEYRVNIYKQRKKDMIRANLLNLYAIADRYNLPRYETQRWSHEDILLSY